MGCYNKNNMDWMAQTTNIYFSWCWSLGCSRSRCQQIQYLMRACYMVHRQRPFSPCILIGQKVRGSFGVSFRRALIPFMRALPSWSNHHSSHFQISSHMGLVLTYGFWEDRNRQSRVGFLLFVSNQLIDAHNQSVPLSRVYVPNQRASGIKCIYPRLLVR